MAVKDLLITSGGEDKGFVFRMVEPIPETELSFSANGIEKKSFNTYVNRESISFENKCYDRILSSPGETLVLGPHILDYMFVEQYIANIAVPDAIIFDIQSDRWMIQELYEFKYSSKKGKTDRGTNKKIEGFSVFLEILRGNPYSFSSLLKSAVGDIVQIPDLITALPNNEIDVVFVVSSKFRLKGSNELSNPAQFRIKYKKG